MFTSSFWKFYLKDDPNLVSIALKTPEWFKGRRYPALAPRGDMLHMPVEQYRPQYAKILAELDPQQVWEDLGQDAVLLCWEADPTYCHRRLVAAWLEEKLGVCVPELPSNYHPKQKSLL